MKRLVMALFVLVLMGGDGEAAEDDWTVPKLLRQCEATLAVRTGDPFEYELGLDIGSCLGFILGVYRTMRAYALLTEAHEDVHIPPHELTCNPDSTAIRAFVEAFINRARSQPEDWQLGSTYMAKTAFTETWPCPAH